MNELFDAAREIQEFLVRHDWQFCIIGGLAAIRGESRRPRKTLTSAC